MDLLSPRSALLPLVLLLTTTRSAELVARVGLDGSHEPLHPHFQPSASRSPNPSPCDGSRPREVMLAVTQMSNTDDRATDVAKAVELVRAAAAQGAQIILLQELFAGYYFCQEQHAKHFSRAEEVGTSELLATFSALARELEVVLPVSFFERAGAAFFNSIAIIDADGTSLGVYRKSHIPDGPGYQEKFYFSPGDTGFRVWKTRYATLGVGICWDQWFPEAARSMALLGAEVLLYPTAIGSEPQDPGLDSSGHWQRVMQGHAAANTMPVMAANRVGTESWPDSYKASSISFYGSSFITDNTGDIVMKMSRTEEGFVSACVDLEQMELERRGWGLFRDRRPSLYGAIATLDGKA